MSPLDAPLALIGIALAVGSLIGVLGFYAACALIERIRR